MHDQRSSLSEGLYHTAEHQCIISIYWTLELTRKLCVFLVANFNYISTVTVKCIGTTVPEKPVIFSTSLPIFPTYNLSNIFREGGIRVEMTTDLCISIYPIPSVFITMKGVSLTFNKVESGIIIYKINA